MYSRQAKLLSVYFVHFNASLVQFPYGRGSSRREAKFDNSEGQRNVKAAYIFRTGHPS